MFPASTAMADQEYPWEQVEASGDFVPPPTMDSQIDQEEDVVKLKDDQVNENCQAPGLALTNLVCSLVNLVTNLVKHSLCQPSHKPDQT